MVGGDGDEGMSEFTLLARRTTYLPKGEAGRIS